MPSVTFYIDILKSRLWVLFVVFVFMLFFLVWPNYWLAITQAAKFVLFIAMIVMLCTISVREQGLVLNRFYHLPWSDIQEIKYFTFLGLPHLRITRKKGLNWSLPLYIYSLTKFYILVVDKAPSGNPLHTYAESAINTQQGAQHGRVKKRRAR